MMRTQDATKNTIICKLQEHLTTIKKSHKKTRKIKEHVRKEKW